MTNSTPEYSPQILHTMLRVTNMQRSISFYTQVLGMHLIRSLHQPDENYQLAFLAFGNKRTDTALELTFNDGITQYDMGNAYGHIAISVENVKQACIEIQGRGGRILHPPSMLKGTNEKIAFISDPDGYQIELIQFTTHSKT